MHGPPPLAARLRHLPALDGLRGLAVLAVVGYHAELALLPGGFLGVELFFVVSGFLITSLLLAEHRRTGRVDLARFWARRARRLLPALALMLVTVAAVVRIWFPEELPRTRGGLLAAAAYVTNWEQIWTGQSYFEALGRPPLLQHLWSLAVEEQYYLVWPLVMAALAAVGGRRLLAVACASGAVAATALMWAVVDPAAPSRAYYGTDTRAGGLLLGGLTALTLIAVRVPRPSVAARRVLDLLGTAALAGVAFAVVTTSEYDASLYRGGFLRFAALTAVVVYAVSVPGSRLGGGLGLAPLAWVGRRSYGLYLWHWPVFQLTRPHLDVPLDGTALLALRLTITFALTELSFRLVEEPVRSGAVGRWWARERRREAGATPAPWGPRAVAAATVAAALAVVGAYVVTPQPPSTDELAAAHGLAPAAGGAAGSRTETSPTTTTTDARRSWGQRLQGAASARPAVAVATVVDPRGPTDDVPAVALPASEAAVPPAGAPPPPPAEPGVPPADAPLAPASSAAPTDAAPPQAVATQPAPQQPAPPSPQPVPPPQPAGPRPAHAVGDSVLLAASEAVRAHFAGAITIDAVVGRQPADGVAAIEAWAPHHPGVDLVVALGTNGIFQPHEVERIMAAAGPERRVVLVTVAVPRRWESATNDAIRTAAAHPNATVVDWHSTVAGDRSLLRSDGVHPGPRGGDVFAAAVRAALP